MGIFIASSGVVKPLSGAAFFDCITTVITIAITARMIIGIATFGFFIALPLLVGEVVAELASLISEVVVLGAV